MLRTLAFGYVLVLVAAAFARDFFGLHGAFDALMTLPVMGMAGAGLLLVWALAIGVLGGGVHRGPRNTR